jgi:hypothetical protein
MGEKACNGKREAWNVKGEVRGVRKEMKNTPAGLGAFQKCNRGNSFALPYREL